MVVVNYILLAWLNSVYTIRLHHPTYGMPLFIHMRKGAFHSGPVIGRRNSQEVARLLWRSIILPLVGWDRTISVCGHLKPRPWRRVTPISVHNLRSDKRQILPYCYCILSWFRNRVTSLQYAFRILMNWIMSYYKSRCL